MTKKAEPQVIPAGKIFFKLAIVGCVLLGFVYASMMLLNSALSALH
ncbi:MAG TPA: hypothetical protein VMI35_15535 [Puia sp.]|nr:hypothetical protein [Puia sp.]